MRCTPLKLQGAFFIELAVQLADITFDDVLLYKFFFFFSQAPRCKYRLSMFSHGELFTVKWPKLHFQLDDSCPHILCFSPFFRAGSHSQPIDQFCQGFDKSTEFWSTPICCEFFDCCRRRAGEKQSPVFLLLSFHITPGIEVDLK